MLWCSKKAQCSEEKKHPTKRAVQLFLVLSSEKISRNVPRMSRKNLSGKRGPRDVFEEEERSTLYPFEQFRSQEILKRNLSWVSYGMFFVLWWYLILPVPFIYIILSVVLRESMFSLLVTHSHQCPANTILHLNIPPTRIQLLLIIFAHWTKQREIIGTVSPSLKSNKHTLRYIQANNFLTSYKIHHNTSSLLKDVLYHFHGTKCSPT